MHADQHQPYMQHQEINAHHTQYPVQGQYQYPVHDMHTHCRNHMHRYVLVQTNDGRAYDGIVEHVDRDHVYLAVPIGGTDRENEGELESTSNALEEQDRSETSNDGTEGAGRQFTPFGGYGYPGYGHPYGGYGYYPRPRRRRFQRFILPLAAITALSLLPYY